jgi:hypothetical protein
VWGSLGLLGLLAVAVPQYLRHPEWLSRYEAEVGSAVGSRGGDLGALSSEDLADLAEIDNLALLLNQLQPTTTAALDIPTADPSRLALIEATPTAPDDSPFAQYLERSRFQVSPAASDGDAAAIPPAAEAPGVRSPSSAPPAADRATDRATEHPLQTALRERLGQVTTGSAATPAAISTDNLPGTSASATPAPPWLVEGSLPGTGQRFIRTTPQMSPPPGTTGYTAPPLPEIQPAPPVPGAASLDLDLDVSPAASGGGAVAPGTAPGVTVPPSVPPAQAAPPFSAPRPPGVYTGNGYINTFADPSSPPN